MKSKSPLHPKSLHHDRYEFPPLLKVNPPLKNHVFTNDYGSETINFFDPIAVKELNKALLLHHYGLQYWDIPPQYLCPPIPSRADYIHHLADLLASTELAQQLPIRCLDIGTGANCIYPLIGASHYHWHFVGTDIDVVALEAAQKNVENNPNVTDKISLRLQKDKQHLLVGTVAADEFFHFALCNPPFHASAKEAAAGTRRKLNNLKKSSSKKSALNFGGQSNELWYAGGEIKFLDNYIQESQQYKQQVLWFTSLVSKEENLPTIMKALRAVKCKSVKIIDMQHGNKKSRILAWSFQL
ncbi:MAG: 23S rRNA (adenine1618-N6)-methyltransferase [Marivirga sp.]|jgi:23S rRNA (adenine1618-N6)-methyltransferase